MKENLPKIIKKTFSNLPQKKYYKLWADALLFLDSNQNISEEELTKFLLKSEPLEKEKGSSKKLPIDSLRSAKQENWSEDEVVSSKLELSKEDIENNELEKIEPISIEDEVDIDWVKNVLPPLEYMAFTSMLGLKPDYRQFLKLIFEENGIKNLFRKARIRLIWENK